MRKSVWCSKWALAVLLAAGLLLCCCPFSAGAADVSKAVYPEWFSFSESCLVLSNEVVGIEKGFYTDSFGPLKGSLIYDVFENGRHGMCYGLAVANAALLNETPALDSFSHADGSTPGTVSDLQKGTVEKTTSLPLMSLIKYGYILQANTDTALNFEKTKNDAAGLYAAVADFVYRGGPPVIVGLLGRFYSHEVLAVGLLGREDIVVCDSNDPTQPYVMDFTGNEWKYSCDKMSWKSPFDSFDYGTNAALLFDNLTAASGETVFPEDYVFNKEEEADGGAEVRRAGMAAMDEDWLLLAVHNTCTGGTEEMHYLGTGGSPLEADDYLLTYYWAPKGSAASVRNQTKDPRSVLLADSNGGILARAPANGSVSAAFSDGFPTVQVKGKKGKAALVALLGMNGDSMDCCIAEGVLDGAELYAAGTSDGFLVDGLKKFTVRFSRRWEEDSKPVKCAGGAVLIRGDRDAFTVSLMGDANADGELTPEDARLVLRCSVSLEDIDRFDFALCDFDRDNAVTPEDARLVLRRTVGLRQ